MDTLPAELIQEIFLRLPVSSVLQCRSVCKTWANLIDDPQFSTMHLANSTGNQTPAFLLCTVETPSGLYFVAGFDNYCGKATKVGNLPIKPSLNFYLEVVVVGSCNGLACLGCRDNILVCNPITREFYLVPQGHRFCFIGCSLGFGFDEESDEYKVVALRPVSYDNDNNNDDDDDEEDFRSTYYRKRNNVGEFEVQVHTLGTSSWRIVGRFRNIGVAEVNGSGVFSNAHLHWLEFDVLDCDKVVSIAAFHLGDEKVKRSIQLPASVAMKHRQWLHLEVLGGSLILVDDSEDEHAFIWMMKHYGLEESWTKEYIIRRRVIDDEPFISFYEVRPLGIQKNNGGILIKDCSGKKLWSYDPRSKIFTDVGILGLSNLFEATPLVPSFVSLNHAMKMDGLVKKFG